MNLTKNQEDIDKIYLYAKDPYEAKHQYLINKREKVGLTHYDDPKTFMENSNNMQDVYKNIEEYNPREKGKALIVFDDMIADMINNKKLNPIVTELVENLIFLLSLLHNLILKWLDEILHTFLLYKFQIKENFSKLLQIIHVILTLKIL